MPREFFLHPMLRWRLHSSFENGKESGQIKEFHESGDIKAIKTYNNGDVDVASIKTFEPKKEVSKTDNAAKFAPSKGSEVKNEELAGIGANKSRPSC